MLLEYLYTSGKSGGLYCQERSLSTSPVKGYTAVLLGLYVTGKPGEKASWLF